MRWRAAALSSAVALLAACGGRDRPAPAHPDGPVRASSHSGHGLEHVNGEPDRDFPPAVAAFHDRLDESWHDEPGPARTERGCAQTARLREQASAIARDAPPARLRNDQHGGWRAAGEALVASIDRLAAECARDGRSEFEDLFGAVHEAFHDLVVIWDDA